MVLVESRRVSVVSFGTNVYFSNTGSAKVLRLEMALAVTPKMKIPPDLNGKELMKTLGLNDQCINLISPASLERHTGSRGSSPNLWA